MVACYEEAIDRKHPSCFLFLLDQSGSMADRFGAAVSGIEAPTKSQAAADALNRLIHTISISCAKGEEYRDYFHIGVIGYGGEVKGLLKSDLLPISQLAEEPLRIESREQYDGTGGLISVKFPLWFDPKAEGGTPMRSAFELAKSIVSKWLTDNGESYPPTVINVTDGASTDGEPDDLARDICGLQNVNGSAALIYNCHISHLSTDPVLYPPSGEAFSDEYMHLLYNMSSELPPKLIDAGRSGGLPVQEGSRGFVFNASLSDLIKFLDIGTRTTQMADIRPRA